MYCANLSMEKAYFEIYHLKLAFYWVLTLASGTGEKYTTINKEDYFRLSHIHFFFRYCKETYITKFQPESLNTFSF